MIKEPSDIDILAQDIFTVEGAGWSIETSVSAGLLQSTTSYNSLILALGTGNLMIHETVKNESMV